MKFFRQIKPYLIPALIPTIVSLIFFYNTKFLLLYMMVIGIILALMGDMHSPITKLIIKVSHLCKWNIVYISVISVRIGLTILVSVIQLSGIRVIISICALLKGVSNYVPMVL